MAAYLIGHMTIKDPAQWKIYVEGVRKSLIPFTAEIIFRATRAAVLAGTHPYHSAVVIKFPDAPALHAWYHSKTYQDLIPIRDQAADVVLIGYDG
jgi:uncharacterized protein (DUF1330 family)